MSDHRRCVRLFDLSSRLLAAACIAALVAVDCAAQDAQQLSGRLYLSIFKRAPAGPHRWVVTVDLATGEYAELLPEANSPRVSPDGRQIAYRVSSTQDKPHEVWIKSLDRNDEPRFLWNAKSIARWLNDGQQLILVDWHDAEKNRSEYVNWRVNADGTGSEPIELPNGYRIVDSTADGKRFLVSGVVRGQLHTMTADSRDAQLVTKPGARVYKGRFSPDGRQIAFLTSRKAATVTLVSSDGTNPRVIFQADGLTEPSDVCWSPDGKRLAVVLFDWIDEITVRSIEPGKDNNFRVVILDADGKTVRPVHLRGLSLHEISEPDWN